MSNELDPNVEAIRERLRERAVIGLRKYGTDTTRTDINLRGWIDHAQEEAMDFLIYLERMKKELP
jgi:hypothetical protein